jgi:hypothetical protein
MMTEVIGIRSRAPKTQSKSGSLLKEKFGADEETLLQVCAKWRASRAQQEKNWAEHSLATGWGTLDDMSVHLDLSPMDQMKGCEDYFSGTEPRTMLGARELLKICVTILAHEDKESPLSDGPLVDIIHNVVASLEWCDADMLIGKKAVQS